MAVAPADVTADVTAAASLPVQPQPRPFSVDEFEAMGRAGIFGRNERVELIEGRIVAMNPIGTKHLWTVSELLRFFVPLTDVRVTSQSPLHLHDQGEPEPDVLVLRSTTPRTRKPTPADALLVIEVADSTLVYDRETKGPLYAGAGVPEYWLVDLNGERIQVYTEPSPIGYRATRLYLRGESLSPAFAPDLTVSVDDVLGPPAAPEAATPDTAAPDTD